MKTSTRTFSTTVRSIGILLISLLSIVSLTASAEESAAADFIVYKNAQCGCCDKWAQHVRLAGYTVAVVSTRDMSEVKQDFGIDPRLQSCHTAVHERSGLVFEGHVPVAHITALIEKHRPDDRGLAVPGMPAGSPGMEMGNRRDSYDVLLLSSATEPTIFR